ncbi:MAG: diaminopimelate epimerase [Chitinophagaceae bacterium]|nr:diaminopimelate epimerase [Chitinophagaceae bacterium]
MKIHFEKYQATGNDFVMLDNRDGRYDSLDAEAVRKLCDRRFGIGGDGLIMLNTDKEYDFEMKYFNANGSLGSMCGNGGRCIIAFAKKYGVIGEETRFIAYDGEHSGRFEDGLVSLKMNPVEGISAAGADKILDTGSPHYVRFVDAVEAYDVFNEGRNIRNSPSFVDQGINVNFVQQLSDNELFVRTYERGVEDETYSCGTGVTASAIAFGKDKNGRQTVNIRTKGGRLRVSYNKEGNRFDDIWLTGPATFVFEGDIEL